MCSISTLALTVQLFCRNCTQKFHKGRTCIAAKDDILCNKGALYVKLTYPPFVQMPSNSQRGHYKLRVEGKAGDSGNVFFNETDIGFDPKQASVFIQLSKPIYKQGQNGRQPQALYVLFVVLIT